VNPTYLKYELIRSVRNKRGFVISLVFPLIFFYLIAGSNRHAQLGGISFPTYYLAGMASFGTMGAMISLGARISAERSVGWTRQLRLTPLSVRNYIRAKVLTGYLTGLISLALLFVAGATLGVHVTPKGVLDMTGLIVVALIPFAALGILIGHLFTPDSMGPVIGGGVSILAFLGGAWGPVGGDHGALHDVSQGTPTYWLVQAGHTLVGAPAWDSKGWIVVAIWTIVLGALAGWAFRRDTTRI
jgi:ABC-2 type transport system permease protein